ncbi:hypothetical protein EFY79_17020 [Hanamia caeni]|uniref:Uncharacterized protein n=1 Tax=Hanamia caeni TaxID=2294116 RepID=A0A3M9N861_9BACT|nr:hypothetical protein [Hanamia caeni]RNI34012.1 hypothetical protein EFY79_17020 [Hanamia caeni]
MKVFLLVLPKSTGNYPAASFYENKISTFKFTKHIRVVSPENIAVREHDQDGRSRPELKFTLRPLS